MPYLVHTTSKNSHFFQYVHNSIPNIRSCYISHILKFWNANKDEEKIGKIYSVHMVVVLWLYLNERNVSVAHGNNGIYIRIKNRTGNINSTTIDKMFDKVTFREPI